MQLVVQRRLVLGGMAALLAACTDGVRPGAVGAALLLPLTGDAADLGRNMARAAMLAGTGRATEAMPAVYDTGDTAEGAAAAAVKALAAGARLLLGPLRRDQTQAVLAVAGDVPVVTFSNDDALAGQGAFVLGITAAQSVSAMFSYAAAQGIKRLAVIARDGPLGVASIDAAVRIAAAGGLLLSATLLRDPAKPGLVQDLRRASGGTLPQAVFLPDGGAALAGFAGGLQGSTMQLMGSVQWGIGDVTGLAALEGAWFTAPQPAQFQPFADRFVARYPDEPGVVAALAYDAALLALTLGDTRQMTRRGLTRAAGFTGALGHFRLRDDGRCQRDLAVLGVQGRRIVVLAEVAGT